MAVARNGDTVRVAITGLGGGVRRWSAAERALADRFALASLATLPVDELEAHADLHASSDYRRHLARVLARRCLTALTGEAPPPPPPLAPRARRGADAPRSNADDDAPRGSAAPGRPPAAPGSNVRRPDRPRRDDTREGFGAAQTLAAPADRVWQALLDPQQLQHCIPGCESLAQTGPDAYAATVKVGLGPVSVRMHGTVRIRDPQPPHAMQLVFHGDAGALGASEGNVQVRLSPAADGGTRLDWWAQVRLAGRLAQFGNGWSNPRRAR